MLAAVFLYYFSANIITSILISTITASFATISNASIFYYLVAAVFCYYCFAAAVRPLLLRCSAATTISTASSATSPLLFCYYCNYSASITALLLHWVYKYYFFY